MNVRRILSGNLRTLLAYNKERGERPYDGKTLAAKSGIDGGTISRIINEHQAPAIDTLGDIAKAFKLRPWQLLVPDINPRNPPVVPESETERELYTRLQQVADEFLSRRGDDEGRTSPADDAGGDTPPSGKSKARKAKSPGTRQAKQ
jgi:transcriptional regulator with XRE-family HTH domain